MFKISELNFLLSKKKSIIETPLLKPLVRVCRVKQVLGSLRSQLPVLSDSEKDMRKELLTIHDQLRHLDNGIKQVRSVSFSLINSHFFTVCPS